MKRDMDLIRDILLKIEEFDFSEEGRTANVQDLQNSFEGFTKAQVQYHYGLLCNANLMEAIDAGDASGDYYIPQGLTWEGHEFLDAARNQTVWDNTKAAIKKQGGSVPMDVLKALLIKGAATAFGL